MKNNNKKNKDVKSAVNLISGAYTLPLIDKLFSNSQRIEDMNDIYFSITALGYRQNQQGVLYDKRIVWNCRYGISAGDRTVGKIGRTAGIFRVGIYF